MCYGYGLNRVPVLQEDAVYLPCLVELLVFILKRGEQAVQATEHANVIVVITIKVPVADTTPPNR
jgi:hypothetical protein